MALPPAILSLARRKGAGDPQVQALLRNRGISTRVLMEALGLVDRKAPASGGGGQAGGALRLEVAPEIKVGFGPGGRIMTAINIGKKLFTNQPVRIPGTGGRFSAPSKALGGVARAVAPFAVGAATTAGAIQLFQQGRSLVQGIQELGPGLGDATMPNGGIQPGKPASSSQIVQGALAGRIILRQWVANGTPFVFTADLNGRNKMIMVQRRDGSIKTYRPYRPIVIGKTLNLTTLARVDRKIDQIVKMARKRMPSVKRRTGGSK